MLRTVADDVSTNGPLIRSQARNSPLDLVNGKSVLL